MVGRGDKAWNFVRIAGVDPFFLGGFKALDGVLVFPVLQQGETDQVIDQARDSFLIGKFLLIFGYKPVGIRGATLERVGEDDLLVGRGGDIGRAKTGDLPKDEAGFIVLAGLEVGLPELNQGLAGEIGTITNLLNFLLTFLQAAKFFGGGRGLTRDFGPERGEVGLEKFDQLLLAGDGSESDDRLRDAAGSEVETGHLQIGLEGESGIRSRGDAGVDLASPGEGGFRVGFFEIRQQLAGALGLGVGLEVVDIFGQLFFLIGGAGGI